jgi:hypothetical protein
VIDTSLLVVLIHKDWGYSYGQVKDLAYYYYYYHR